MSSQQFNFRRVVKRGRVHVTGVTYRLTEPVPDNTPVVCNFAGSIKEGRSMRDCLVFMAKPGTGWPYGAGKSVLAEQTY